MLAIGVGVTEEALHCSIGMVHAAFVTVARLVIGATSPSHVNLKFEPSVKMQI